MSEMEERELLVRSLKGYLTDLADSGVDELAFGDPAPVAAAEAPAGVALEAFSATAPLAGAAAAPTAPETLEPACRQEGNPAARLLFVMTGSGFGGAAGDLLAKIIAGMKFKPDEVCLLSFDAGEDAAAMRCAVGRRINAVAPEVVVALGEDATSLMLEGRSLDDVRGRFHEVQGRWVMPTLHPEFLLADEALKRHVWEDMKQVMRRLGAGP
jgi:hypothetical protein